MPGCQLVSCAFLCLWAQCLVFAACIRPRVQAADISGLAALLEELTAFAAGECPCLTPHSGPTELCGWIPVTPPLDMGGCPASVCPQNAESTCRQTFACFVWLWHASRPPPLTLTRGRLLSCKLTVGGGLLPSLPALVSMHCSSDD